MGRAVANAACMEPLIETYITEAVALRRFTKGTAANVRSACRALVAVADGRPIDAGIIREYLASIGSLAPGTVYARFSAVKNWARWLLERGHVDLDATVGVKVPRPPRRMPRALAADDVTRLLAVAPDARARAIIALMYEEGARCIEVERLELGDWNRATRVLILHGKGDKQRAVWVTPRCEELLDAYLAEHPATWGPLIRSYQQPRRSLHADAISHLCTQWFRAAGIQRAPRDGRSAHALRHTAATELMAAGRDPQAVQEFLGHADLATTQGYIAAAGLGRVKAAMQARTEHVEIPVGIAAA